MDEWIVFMHPPKAMTFYDSHGLMSREEQNGGQQRLPKAESIIALQTWSNANLSTFQNAHTFQVLALHL